MLSRQLFFLIATTLSLVACGAQAAVTPPTPRTAAPIPTDPPRQLPATAVPTNVPVAQPTSTPIPPTLIPATPIPPTRPPALPTAIPTQANLPATTVPTSAPTRTPPQFGEEVLFLRAKALIAIDVRTRQERSIAENVADFVPAPNSVQIALIRGVGAASEIWLVQRDGSNLRQITRNRRAEASLAWSPDSSALAYGSSSSSDPYDSDWLAWSRWCAVSEIRVVDLTSTAEKTLAPGCDPAISPDGKRIAYVAPPASAPPEGAGPLTINSVRLINRLGQNGWNFARAQGGTSDGLIVYAPAWSPDGGQVSYHRYVGMQVEVDLNLTEIGRSFEGKGQALADGAGWLLPARFSPDGQLVVISEHDAGNARGLIGYGAWRTQIVRLAGTREIMLPEGPKKVLGQAVEVLPGAQRATWAPGASALAVEIPAGWQLNADPTGWGQSAGEIWRWLPGKGPTERMAANVDYSSPLSWLPAN